MKRKGIIVAALVVIASLMLFAVQTPEKGAPRDHRFQIVSAQGLEQGGKPDVSVPAPAVFLLDTGTGKVWKYQAAYTFKLSDGKTKAMSDSFYPVGFLEARKQ